MTVFLAYKKRPAFFAAVTAASLVVPIHLSAAAIANGGEAQSQLAQSGAAKPSADVIGNGSLPSTQLTNYGGPVAKPETPAVAQHLDVQFADGKITVDAANAGLNGVLHEIAVKAGYKITGGVSDERVFGRYGPAAPAAVLALLLDGTGSNVLLVDDAKGASQLVLTPRVGGVTPPNPAAAQEEAREENERSGSRYVPPVRPFQPPGPNRGPLTVPPFETTLPPGRPGSNPPVQPDAFQSSGDNRTPQQIYDQLQNANQKQSDTQTPQ